MHIFDFQIFQNVTAGKIIFKHSSRFVTARILLSRICNCRYVVIKPKLIIEFQISYDKTGRKWQFCNCCYNFILNLILISDSNDSCNEGPHVLIKHCCNKTNPCEEGQGDCDSFYDCKGALICGEQGSCDKTKFPSQYTECCVKYIGSFYIFLMFNEKYRT